MVFISILTFFSLFFQLTLDSLTAIYSTLLHTGPLVRCAHLLLLWPSVPFFLQDTAFPNWISPYCVLVRMPATISGHALCLEVPIVGF